MESEETRRMVRQGYADIAQGEGNCCSGAMSCCGTTDLAWDIAKAIGYSEEDLAAAPEGANLGLGCGNPSALASLKEGEVVLDLGSGAGFDCFLAAEQVGDVGRVIGVDMTPEMVGKARANARQGNYTNVEFRLGEIEHLPAADNSVDVIISNCVINLAPEKGAVFSEALRVLKPGGRLMIADIVLQAELPASIRNSVEAYVGCLAGAMMQDEYMEAIEAAGFEEIRIVAKTSFGLELMANDPTARALAETVGLSPEDAAHAASSALSVTISALKPGGTG